ncbi:hypothetical protein [Natranaeroarchaeum aerophilus]|uniref:MinD-like ATPase involved in chromosome partitioning or flagellar assembly n=1 Tax=Natranaeroarchaeum aerophilus TaxID=2917711 RepID=A0AAE3FTG7_9EURY|nr:hypothetical protein [Natranaeroarchaeum aerophilus]MCL9814623.1 hypothetical protein [Natranaeroarchaeum aerophilus]
MTGTVFAFLGGRDRIGTTTAAVSVGVSMAETATRVAVVDAAFDSDGIEEIIDVQSDDGVRSVLRGDATIDEAMVTGPHGVDYLPSGSEAPAPTDVRTHRLVRAATTLRERYELVLLDLGHGGGVDIAMGLELADEAILVSGSAEDDLSETAEAATVVRYHGCRIRGTVLSRVPSVQAVDIVDVTERLRTDVLAVVPEDDAVRAAAGAGQSLLRYDPDSDAAMVYWQLASSLSGAGGLTGPVLPASADGPESDSSGAATETAAEGDGESGDRETDHASKSASETTPGGATADASGEPDVEETRADQSSVSDAADPAQSGVSAAPAESDPPDGEPTDHVPADPTADEDAGESAEQTEPSELEDERVEEGERVDDDETKKLESSPETAESEETLSDGASADTVAEEPAAERDHGKNADDSESATEPAATSISTADGDGESDGDEQTRDTEPAAAEFEFEDTGEDAESKQADDQGAGNQQAGNDEADTGSVADQGSEIGSPDEEAVDADDVDDGFELPTENGESDRTTADSDEDGGFELPGFGEDESGADDGTSGGGAGTGDGASEQPPVAGSGMGDDSAEVAEGSTDSDGRRDESPIDEAVRELQDDLNDDELSDSSAPDPDQQRDDGSGEPSTGPAERAEPATNDHPPEDALDDAAGDAEEGDDEEVFEGVSPDPESLLDEEQKEDDEINALFKETMDKVTGKEDDEE